MRPKQMTLPFTLPFLTGLDVDPATDSYPEEQVKRALARAGYLFHPKPANDTEPCRAVAFHQAFPDIVLRLQSDLRPLVDIDLTADLHWIYNGGPPRNLIVEIDGDEWHAKRSHRDKKLDRLIQRAPGSWSIFRYPAKEVFHRRLADHVVDDIHRYIRGWYEPTKRRA